MKTVRTSFLIFLFSGKYILIYRNFQDRDLLTNDGLPVVYILSLAVRQKYQRQGLATRLLNHLFATVINRPPYPRAIYLHVLSTNSVAIKFYHKNGFSHHATLMFAF